MSDEGLKLNASVDFISISLLAVLAFIAYLFGLNLDVLEIDSAQYASISREMAGRGNFLIVDNNLADYLDKPPLLLWLSALSFKIFGLSNFAFKLPAFLFTLIGVYSTFRLTDLYYNRKTGLLAAWILFVCQAYFLFNQDVRTDVILAGATIFAIWRLAEYVERKKAADFILGFVGVAFAMLAKGLIGLVAPAAAIGCHLLYKRKWSALFNWRWFLGLVIIAVLLAPMTYGLYRQFGWGGVEFYYWTYSFGRIAGESKWSNEAGGLFFIHTYLWALLPWSILGIYAVAKRLVRVIKTKFSPDSLNEIVTLGGGLILFVALLYSGMQAPQNIFFLFPLFAIMTAVEATNAVEKIKSYKILLGAQRALNIAIWVIAGAVVFRFFSIDSATLWIIAALLFSLYLYLEARKDSRINKLIVPASAAIVSLNLILNIWALPSLFEYQSGAAAAEIYKKNKTESEKIVGYKCKSYSLDFYSRAIVPKIDDFDGIKKLSRKGNLWIYIREADFKRLLQTGFKPEKKYELPHYQISNLNFKFLNPKSRNQTLELRYLIKF